MLPSYCSLDPRLVSYIDPKGARPAKLHLDEIANNDDQEDDESNKELASMDAFWHALLLPTSKRTKLYISDRSPFGTQQGIKGAEFDRVLVVLDDAESTHNQFSYEKYLGLKALSDKDQEHIAAGEERPLIERAVSSM